MSELAAPLLGSTLRLCRLALPCPSPPCLALRRAAGRLLGRAPASHAWLGQLPGCLAPLGEAATATLPARRCAVRKRRVLRTESCPHLPGRGPTGTQLRHSLGCRRWRAELSACCRTLLLCAAGRYSESYPGYPSDICERSCRRLPRALPAGAPAAVSSAPSAASARACGVCAAEAARAQPCCPSKTILLLTVLINKGIPTPKTPVPPQTAPAAILTR